MANVTSLQTILDGAKNTVIKFEGILDTSDLGSTIVVDASTLQGPPTKLRIDRIQYSIEDGLSLNLLWDATSDVRVLELNGHGEIDGNPFGGFPNNAGSGITGDILATTTGYSGTMSFTVILECSKQSF